MLQWVPSRLRHHLRCLWILNRFIFGWHRRIIDAQGVRPRIAHRDGVQGRDVLGIVPSSLDYP